MAVNGGAGNAISFSEIQSFYGGSNPTSLSEYNRGGSLVPSSFAGSVTATTGTTSQTVGDFGVTVTTLATGYTSFSTTITQGNSGFSGGQTSGNWNVIRENSSSGTGTWTARVLDNATTLTGSCDQKALTVTKNGTGVVSLGNSGGSWSVSCSPGDVIVWTCSAGAGGSGTINRSQSWNWGSGGAAIQYTANTNGGTSGSISAYKVVFANNNSTGDTYTLTSDSTGSETVYSSSESQNVRNNDSSNSWLLAYDNVTGAGPGTAGDINVTETSAFSGSPGSLVSRANSQASGTLYTITADDALISLRGNHPSGASDETVSATFTITRNGSSVFSQSLSNGGDGAYASYIKGPVYNNGSGLSLSISFPNFQSQTGDVISISNVQGNAGVSSQRRSEQFTTVFTNSSSSKSYTLGSSTTGGAAVMSAGSTRNAQTTSSSGSAWAVYFDTSSGNCNTNIPTTISSGNSVNLDLFNAPGTPVG